MKTYSLRLANLFLASVILLTFGCSPKIYQTQYQKVPYLSLAKDSPPSQTKGGITVALRTTTEKDYAEIGLTKPITVKHRPTTVIVVGADAQGLVTEDIFYSFNLTSDMAVFMVTINNNTDHILRMNDSRIVFIEPSLDDPKPGMNKDFLLQSMTDLAVYKNAVSTLTTKYPNTDPESINQQVANALKDIFMKMKIINNLGKEIIPAMKTDAFLIFDISPKKFSEGKISFVDVVSKTDQAGNPTEKVRFDFQTNLNYAYYKQSPSGAWSSIDENDFNNGSSHPTTYYYDKKTQNWVEGTGKK